MLLSVTKKTEQHRRVKEYEKIIKVTIKPQYTLEKRMERTNIVYFEKPQQSTAGKWFYLADRIVHAEVSILLLYCN